MSGIEPGELSRCLFNEANDAFFIVDPPSLRVLDANATAQRLTGRRKKALLAMKLDDLLEGADADSTRKLLRACHTTTRFFHSKEGYTLNRDDGTPTAVNVSVSRIHGETVTLGLVVVRDVTERTRAHEALGETNERLLAALNELKRSQEMLVQQERMRALGHMASGAAHELNNLLAPLVAYTDLLLRRIDLSPEVREQLILVSTATQDAADVVRRLQTVRSSDPGQTEVLDLRELIRQVPGLTRPKWYNEALRTGREITFDLQTGDVPPVEGNPSGLRQVVMNLVFNAVEAMPDGGRLTLHLHARSNDVSVEVADTGVGMTDEQRKRCFDPFFTTKERGSGLGLSVCHGIVQRHGGSMEIDSQQGQGTTVRMILPGVAHPPKDAVSRAEDVDRPSVPSDLRILYIDDDERVRASFAMMIGSCGWQVDLAEDGPTGVAMLQSAAYDVVITDLGMPGMDGKELTRVVKRVQPKIPVIVISGWDESQVHQEFDGGVKPDFIIPKPANLDRLEETLIGIQTRQDRNRDICSLEERRVSDPV